MQGIDGSAVQSRDAREGIAWFAVRVRSNFEWNVQTVLKHKGYEVLLPTYRARRHWADRVKEIQLPLFVGYVFCRFSAERRLPILQTPGVVNVVGVGKTPVPIEDHEIGAIRSIMQSNLPAQPWPFLRVGEHVEIVRGPLAGLDGIMVSFKGAYRLIVSVELLHRSVAAEIEADWVRSQPGNEIQRRRETA